MGPEDETSRLRLLITEPIHPAGVDWMRELGVTPLYAYEGDDWRAVADQIVPVLVRSHKVTAEFLDQLPAQKIVGKNCVGVNTIDLEATALGASVPPG
jgi:phosphoglycerate dehydrogenase-like enzyme